MKENDYRLVTEHLKLTRFDYLHNRDPTLVIVVRTTSYLPHSCVTNTGGGVSVWTGFV